MSNTSEPNQPSLRVLVLGLNYAPETTGIAPYTTGLARHLAGRGYAVSVVTGRPHYPEWRVHAGYEAPQPASHDRGVYLIRVPHPIPGNPAGLSRIAMEVAFAVRTALHLLRRRTDIVVAVSPALLTLIPALLLRPLRGYRVGAVVQDLYGAALTETGLGGRLLARATGWLELQLLRRTDRVTVIHDVFRRRLIAAGLPPGRIEVIPNWAHVSMPLDADRSETRRQLGWDDGDFIALHAGNMGAKQGLEGLIDVARLSEERGSRVRVVLLGNGSRRDALRDYADKIRQVTFIDSLPEGKFEAALAAADCLLLHEKPGVVEMSVPSKLTTYFTAGRPVVAATHPKSGAAALMALSDAGAIVRAGDAAEILDAIESLAADPARAAVLGISGQTYAAEHLTGARSLALYEGWIETLADPTSHRCRPTPFCFQCQSKLSDRP